MFITLILLLAIVIGTLRGFPSLYQHYLPTIQQNISSLLGKPVEIDNILIDWQGYTPLITVEKLAIYDSENKKIQLFYANSAQLSFDLYKTLLDRKFIINEIALHGSTLEAIRTLDEKILLNGIDISERVANRKKLNSKDTISITLLDSSIAITDETQQLDYFFDQVNVSLTFDKERLKVNSEFLLPNTLGDALVLIADVKDFDQGLKNVKGSLYSKGENINLALISDFFPQLQVGVKSGNSDFEVWGNFKSVEKRLFSGNLNLRNLIYHDIEEPVEGIEINNEITGISAEFAIKSDEDDWKLALNNAEVKAGRSIWPVSKYAIQCWSCDLQDFSLALKLDYVNSNHLMSTLQHFPIFTPPLKSLLTKADLSGVFEESNILTSWQNRELVKYSYKTNLQGFTISRSENGFSLNNLTGKFEGNHTQADIEVSSPNLSLRVDKIFNNEIKNQNVKGLIKWRKVGDNNIFSFENIRLRANQVNANFQGSIQIAEQQKIYSDIQILIPEAQLISLQQYLPYKKFKPKLRNWLLNAVKQGVGTNAKILIQGDPRYPSLKGYEGAFEINGHIADGVLDYKPGWPIASDLQADITLRNSYLSVVGDRGKILDSTINNASAYINDLTLPRLVINGKASGPAANSFEFLTQSSLLAKDSQILKHISADGNVKLDLDLDITLSKKLVKERLVSGVVEFDNTNLTVNAANLPFKNIKGKLKFDRDGAEGEGISARLFDETFLAKASKLDAGRTNVSIAGAFNLDKYLTSNYTDLIEYINGISHVSTRINLPRFGKNVTDNSIHINFDSKLEGTSVLLPEPFKKSASEYRDLAVSAKYQPGSYHPLFVSYANKLFIQATSDLSAIELRVGDMQFNLPDKGVKVSGKFDELNINEWLEISNSYQSPAPEVGSSASVRVENNNTFTVDEFDIQANRVLAANLNIENVDFQLKKNDQNWLVEIDSSLAKGSLSYPRGKIRDQNSIRSAIGKFDYLRLNESGKKGFSIDPRDIAGLEISTKELKYKDYLFENIELKTENTNQGMKINSLTANDEDTKININGLWQVINDTQTTSIKFSIASQNLHNTLSDFNFGAGVNKGEGGVAGMLNWEGAPYQFSVDSLQGTANVRLKKGSIVNVETGAGRLIGLFNLNEITRRLSLDFKDFLNKGYVFDKIRGDLEISDKNVTTDNLSIQGPSADILIQGRTGLIAKDYDQIVTVTPQVSGGLPWIGLIIGGPVGAGAVMVGEKVAKSVGINVNKVTEVKYSMTGSWSEPIIEPISRKVANEKLSTKNQNEVVVDSENKTQEENLPKSNLPRKTLPGSNLPGRDLIEKP